MNDNDLIRRGDAVKLLREIVKNWSCGCDVRYCRCAEAREQWDFAADEIADTRALPTATVAGVRAEALREAARVVMKRADDYHDEHGSYDYSTDVTEYLGNGSEWMEEWEEISSAILALIDTPATTAPDKVALLVGAVEALNAACDNMWNDYGRLEPNPLSMGQRYRIKESHMRAITEAQQALKPALAALKGGDA